MPHQPDRPTPSSANRTLRGRLSRMLVRIRNRVPPGLRLALGLLLIAGGMLGFLPVLGFWMIPLGVMVAALDVKPVLNKLRQRGK